MTAAAALGQVIIRSGEPSDAAFVHSSWLKSYLHNSRWSQLVGECYHQEHSDVIKRLMDRGQVSVAAWSEDPETIIGWCCVEVGVLHYAFVRKEFRRTGIARLLLDSMLTDDVLVTHRTTDADRIRWPAGWRYNVYAGLR